ncbi:ABC transporter ATP-binding protein [Faucicola mancuniensis]|uniref:ABC transporter ATP-binding protein n=1 Tax=Faucicola mancuniensis TaxID=1309795 RepID=UPI003977509D
MTNKILIKTNDLAVLTTDNHCLVEPISLTLEQGKNLTILGETGSGKSLLAQAIMGALPNGLVARGDVWLNHNDKNDSDNLEKLSEKQRQTHWGNYLAMLPQEPTLSLDPTMNIFWQTWESLFFVAKKDKTTAKTATKSALETLGLTKFTDYYPHELSGGMAQRASIAVATTGDASIVIADEPTKGLDEKNKQIVIALLQQIAKNGGTLLTITHDIDVAVALSDDIMVMKNGQLLEHGHAQTVINAPKSDYAKQLIASAPSNWQTKEKEQLSDEILLNVQDLTLTRGTRTLFAGLNFSLKKGEILGLVGDSGIGKSSLGDALCGLLKPKHGQIIWQNQPKRQQVLKLYQDPPSAFASHVPLQTLLDDVIDKHGLDRSRIPYLLQALKLNENLLKRSAQNVSGGELQRIAILRALLFNPVLLFADEVTNRLDPITQKETMDLLVEQCKLCNCTLVMVSHDSHLINHYAHQVIDLTAYYVAINKK